MDRGKLKSVLIAAIFVGLIVLALAVRNPDESSRAPDDRQEVVFWHFWGGPDRDVVEGIVAEFNRSQQQYWVRAIHMPGNNLDAKLFLSVAGGSPPDLINQDDPVLADWAKRGAIQRLADFAPADEVDGIRDWMFPAARQLSIYQDELYGVCNGLDIRALYFNQTVLDQHGLEPPQTIEQLDRIARQLSPPDETGPRDYFAYLPDSRRLWAWGIVFGGRFYDPATGQVTADSPPIVSALEWMSSYSRRYGPDNIAAFRTGDQSLPGKTFPLLPLDDQSDTGRYVLLMDGQWRVRDIARFQSDRRSRGTPPIEFGVCPLPAAPGGRSNAGWANGNLFLVPRGCKQPTGAWEFIKFWTGYQDPSVAARACADGGWVPVAQSIVDHPEFQDFLDRQPLFREFVRLAAGSNQVPIPVVPGAPFFKRELELASGQAMSSPDRSPGELLRDATTRIQQRLDDVVDATVANQ